MYIIIFVTWFVVGMVAALLTPAIGFIVGVVAGIGIVVVLIKLCMSNDPLPCLVFFGALVLLAYGLATLGLWWLFG
jgi:hypothetical protein